MPARQQPLPAPPEAFATRVVVYSSIGCSYCVMAIRLLEREGVAFERVDVSNDRHARRWLVQRTGRRTVPQIFVDGQSIGGYDDLVELHVEIPIAERLQAPRASAV